MVNTTSVVDILLVGTAGLVALLYSDIDDDLPLPMGSGH